MKLTETQKTKFRKVFDDYKHLLLLSYYSVILIFYFYVNKNILVDDIEVLVNVPIIDDLIPFCKYMAIPYVLWYPYIVVPLVYFAFKDKDAFYKLCLFMFGGMTICYISYILVPNGIGPNFRPVLTENDIFSRILNTIYAGDNPTNSCPSMHTLDSIAVYTSIRNSKSLKDNKIIVYSSLVLTISICAATVLVKQHSIIDVVIALVICVGIYMLLYPKSEERALFREKNKKAVKRV